MEQKSFGSKHDKESLDQVMPQVYAELRRLASAYLSGERQNHTLQATALVHEAYMRLVTQHSVDFGNRAQMLGVAAQMMRRILRTHDERRLAEKRGGDMTIVCLTQSNEPVTPALVFSEVDEALDRLVLLNERQASVVELRIFGGLSAEEIAEFLKISPATANRDWSTGRLWMMQELSPR